MDKLTCPLMHSTYQHSVSLVKKRHSDFAKRGSGFCVSLWALLAKTPPPSHTAPHIPIASCYSNFAHWERCQTAFPKNFISSLRNFYYFKAHNKSRLLKERRTSHYISSQGSKCRTIISIWAAEQALDWGLPCSSGWVLPIMPWASYHRPAMVCCIIEHTQNYSFTKELHLVISERNLLESCLVSPA